MSSSCDNLRIALKDCLLSSDCVVKKGYLPSECLKEHRDELPEQCLSLRQAMFDCKRGMLDMRKRFRGNNVGATVPHLKDHSTTSTPNTNGQP
ncbi:cytochrome c oxidase assembly protein PET191-domain-containing protein [Amylocystis lapponica]|nr:cytochrome c oxidase assembly protein PET191-domain-containing protein [Amylocystis lapponica]